MAEGIFSQAKAGRPATQYSATVQPNEVSAGHLDVLVEPVANGSVLPLVAQLLDGANLPTADLKDLRQFVRLAEQRSRDQEKQT